MMHFIKPDFCISEFYIPKALFCSSINVVLQIFFELQARYQEKQHVSIACIPMVINITRNYLYVMDILKYRVETKTIQLSMKWQF